MEQKRAVFFKFVELFHDQNFPQELKAKVCTTARRDFSETACIVTRVASEEPLYKVGTTVLYISWQPYTTCLFVDFLLFFFPPSVC